MMYSQELLDQVIHYIDDEISLHDLEEWLVPRAPELVRNPEDSDLIAEMELQLAEYSNGLRDEAAIKRDLSNYIESDNLWFPKKPDVFSQTFSSSNRIDKFIVSGSVNQPIRIIE